MSYKKGFKWRGVTTFILAFSTLFSAVSGIILYFTPNGRIAKNTDWSLLGMNKWGWENLHIIFSLLLLIIILFHLYYNWRVIFHFFWSKLQSSVNLTRELIVSAMVILAVFLGTIYSIEPFSSIIDINEDFKHQGDQRSAGMGWGRFQNEHAMAGQSGRNYYGNFSQTDPQQGFGKGRGIYSRMDQERGNGNAAGRDLHGNISQSDPQQGFGKGRGIYSRMDQEPGYVNNRGRSFHQTESVAHSEDTHLRGRDIVGIGKRTALSGTLAAEKDEWVLKSEGSVYNLHFGPKEYLTAQGITLRQGQDIKVSGFLHQNDLSVIMLQIDEKIVQLRNNSGQPAWAGKGAGHGRFYNNN